MVDLPSELVIALTEQEALLSDVSITEAQGLLDSNEVDAVLTLDSGTLNVEVEGSDAAKTGATIAVVQAAVQEVTTSQRNESIQNITDYSYSLRVA